MAKQIIWSIKAKNEQIYILEYWYHRNKSTQYSRKLFKLINEAIEKLAKEAIPRRSTEFSGISVKIVRDYKIYFKEDDQSIFVITIWDTRQDPDKLEKLLKS